MSSLPKPSRPSSIPLLLALGGALGGPFLTAPALFAAPLFLSPGWGLLRTCSSVDRHFGTLAFSLLLSPLVVGALTMAASAWPGAPDAGPLVYGTTLLLCAIGTWRYARYLRRPVHDPDYSLWPARAGLVALLVLAVVGAVSWAQPPGLLAGGGAHAAVGAVAGGWARGGESPLQPGAPLPYDTLLEAAAGGISAASGLHPLWASQLLVVTSLVALLLCLAETAARLWGNRGSVRTIACFVLLLNPLASLFALTGSGPPATRLTPGFDGTLTTALSPFLDDPRLAHALAWLAMLLCATLFAVRRASRHVPRVAGLAALGLAASEPALAWLVLPGWILGLLLARLACRGGADEVAGATARRPGEPRVLRAPFWRLALPIGLGAGLALWIAGAPPPPWSDGPAARDHTWALLCALGPACIVFIPGVRHLNASPGREAFFFLGATAGTALLGVACDVPGDGGALAARALALVLAPAAGVGLVALGDQLGWRVALPAALGALCLLPAPALVLAHQRARPPAAVARTPQAWEVLALDRDLVAGLASARARSDEDAVVAVDAALDAEGAALASLVAGRTLMLEPADAPLAVAAWRARPGMGRRELWVLAPSAPRGGVEAAHAVGTLALARALVPDVLLVTVAGLRPDRVEARTAPQLAALAARAQLFAQAVTPSPDTVPALATLLAGEDLVEHDLRSPERAFEPGTPTFGRRLAGRGYRTAAAVALGPESGVVADFERLAAWPDASADALVDEALALLAAADPRPVVLWLHVADLVRPPPPGADASTLARTYDERLLAVDAALGRLAASWPAEHWLVLTAPHGMNLSEHDAPWHHGGDLFEPSVRVPLIVGGFGLPPARSDELVALQDVQALVLDGRWPQRQLVFLESGARAHAGAPPTGRFPPGLDPSARGAAARLWGVRTAASKVLLTGEDAAGAGALSGVAYDLADDPGERQPLVAPPEVLELIDEWRRAGAPPHPLAAGGG